MFGLFRYTYGWVVVFCTLRHPSYQDLLQLSNILLLLQPLFKWLLVTYTKDGYVRRGSVSGSVIFVSFAAGTFRDLPLSRKAFGPPSWSMPGLLTPYSHTFFTSPFGSGGMTLTWDFVGVAKIVPTLAFSLDRY